METNTESSGVEKLIQRLQDEGVSKGRDTAEALVAEARKESMKILDDARREADEIVRQAKGEAEKTRATGEDALRQACRDATLRLRELIREDFSNRVRQFVSHSLTDQKFLEQLILDVARRSMPEDSGSEVQVLLPADVVSEEELRKTPEEATEGSLAKFVLGLTGDILREGLTFLPGEDDTPGIRVQIVDQDVQIELTDKAITELLLQHLRPRLRAALADA
jgi:V/A-type H+-transporting ATPase subunit E